MNIEELCTDDNLIYTYKNYGVRCPNKYYLLNEDTIAIRATNISGEIKYALIDKEDFTKIKMCNWKLKKDCLTYYLANSRYGMIHKIINNCPNNLEVDHKDGNGLNNKKSNLRNVTNDVNARNRHQVTGIVFDDIKGIPRFRVKWNDVNKKQCYKDFSKAKYETLDKAYEQAKKYRIYIETTIYEKPIINVPTVQGHLLQSLI